MNNQKYKRVFSRHVRILTYRASALINIKNGLERRIHEKVGTKVKIFVV